MSKYCLSPIVIGARINMSRRWDRVDSSLLGFREPQATQNILLPIRVGRNWPSASQVSPLFPDAEERAALELVSWAWSATGTGILLGTWWLNKRAKLIMRGLPQSHSLPVFCAPSTLQSAQSTVPHLPLTQDHSFSITHFTEEETESQKSEVTCQSQDWLGSGNEIPAPAPLSPQALTFREEGTWSWGQRPSSPALSGQMGRQASGRRDCSPTDMLSDVEGRAWGRGWVQLRCSFLGSAVRPLQAHPPRKLNRWLMQHLLSFIFKTGMMSQLPRWLI